MRAVFEDRLFSSSPSQHQDQLSPGGCRGRRGRFHVWRTASSWAPWRRAYCWRGFEKRWVVSSAPPASRPVGQLLTTPHRTPHTCDQDFQLVMASMAKILMMAMLMTLSVLMMARFMFYPMGRSGWKSAVLLAGAANISISNFSSEDIRISSIFIWYHDNFIIIYKICLGLIPKSTEVNTQLCTNIFSLLEQ